MALLVMPQSPLGFSVAMETWMIVDTLPSQVFFSGVKKLDFPFWEHEKYFCIHTHNSTSAFFYEQKDFVQKKNIKALDPERREVKLSLFALNPAVCLSVFSVPWNRDEQGWHSLSKKIDFFQDKFKMDCCER